jgi:hypothetical protein
MNSQGLLDIWLCHPPGWPLLEALAITAAALLVSVLAVELVGALFSCLQSPTGSPVILS